MSIPNPSTRLGMGVLRAHRFQVHARGDAYQVWDTASERAVTLCGDRMAAHVLCGWLRNPVCADCERTDLAGERAVLAVDVLASGTVIVDVYCARCGADPRNIDGTTISCVEVPA